MAHIFCAFNALQHFMRFIICAFFIIILCSNLYINNNKTLLSTKRPKGVSRPHMDANNNSCGYTRLLPEVTLWVIALGWDRFGFPARFSPPVTLQIITKGQLLTWRYLIIRVEEFGWSMALDIHATD